MQLFASQSNALATFTFNHVTMHEEAKAEDANLCFFAEKEILARGKVFTFVGFNYTYNPNKPIVTYYCEETEQILDLYNESGAEWQLMVKALDSRKLGRVCGLNINQFKNQGDVVETGRVLFSVRNVEEE